MKAKIASITAGCILLLLGIALFGNVIATQPLNIVPASPSDQNITLNANSFPTYPFTVYAENPTTFIWQLDGVTVPADNPNDNVDSTGTTTYTLQTSSLMSGDHVLVCSQTDQGDSITFSIYVINPAVTPTPAPTETPEATPTPTPIVTNNPSTNPTNNPYATPTPIINGASPTPEPITKVILSLITPQDTTSQVLMTVVSILLIGLGGFLIFIGRKL